MMSLCLMSLFHQTHTDPQVCAKDPPDTHTHTNHQLTFTLALIGQTNIHSNI